MKRLFEAIVARLLLTVLYGGCLLLCEMARWVRFIFHRNSRQAKLGTKRPFRVMAIGTFYTRNWCRAHLRPLARFGNAVAAVVDGPTETFEGVEYVHPAQAWSSIFGRAVAKSIAAVTASFRHPPDLVMGYHIVPNGLIALVVAKWFGARAAYQVTGGPVQLMGGGAGSENILLRKLGWPSWWIERLALTVARQFDLVVVRGGHARKFMEDHGVGRDVRIIPGSIDASRFNPDDRERPYDLVTVGRLVPVKQLDQFIHVVARLREHLPEVRAVVVGDGPERGVLQRLASSLGLSANLEFAGHVDDVERILKRSKIFVLTSQSEGLSIAMAEAMAAGVVPVVADVGDLSELVCDGVNGRLIQPDAISVCENAVRELLGDRANWARMSEAARRAVLGYNDVDAVAAKWSQALAISCDWPAWARGPTRFPKPSAAPNQAAVTLEALGSNADRRP